MGQIIKIDFSSYNTNQEDLYEKKLIRIRDEIEDYLNQASTIEEDDLAIALAAGRYASMKLAKLTDEESTKKRKELRKDILEFKKNRRIPLGPYATFYFESYETMLAQVHEMLYIEKGGDQQLKDEYDKFMNSVVIPDFQEPLLKVLNRIIKRDTKYSNIELGILNVSPVGDSAKVDLNAVVTINEARKMLGLEMLEDERGEQFVNENAVQNIEEDTIDSEVENEINNTYQNSVFAKTYADYPDSAVNNAKRGIKLNDEVNNKCATNVGKQRAQDIANRRGLSFSTIKRTFSYLSRAEEYYDPSDTKACGTISYLLWGGKSMKSWAERKIKEIENS